MLNAKDLENRILDKLRSVKIDNELIKEFRAETNAYERAGYLLSIIERAVSGIDILSDGGKRSKTVDPPFLFFNGELYQSVSFQLFRRCVRIYLQEMGMNSQDWLRFRNPIMSSAKEPVILTKFNRHPKYIAFKNCVVDFETLETKEFSPDIHVDYRLDYDFDLEQDCPRWKLFLEQVLPDPTYRTIIQQFFGLAFLDRYNNENKVEKALILVGEGSNGKSVIFETIMNIFGTRNMSNMDLNSLSKGGDEGQRNMAMLENKRFNYCSEEQIGKVIQRSDIFKTLVSGEPVYARRIGENSFRIDNLPFLVFNMNKLPKFNDDTHGLFRRLLIVPFSVIIPDELQDRRLPYKLKEERSGILKWLYDGYIDLKNNGFQFPSNMSTQRAILGFMNNQDSISGWIAKYGLRNRPKFGHINDAPKEELSTNLYRMYKKYCYREDLPAVTIHIWGRVMSEKGYEKRRSADGWYYIYYGDDDGIMLDDSMFKFQEGVSKIV